MNNRLHRTLDDFRLLKLSPLEPIAKELEEYFDFFRQVSQSPSSSEQAAYGLEIVASILENLPQSFEERFEFDAVMIQAIAQEWNGQQQKLSGTLIPCSGEEWLHKSFSLPFGPLNGIGKSISLIHIPGEDALDEVDLLTYPFMCHEMAHNLLYFNDPYFKPEFNRELNQYLNSLRLKSIADQGKSRIQSQRTISQIEELWSPGANHQNWAHEITMDIVALWTCGPAYIAAFQDEIQDEVEKKGKDPYFIGQSHPPYAVRIDILERTSDRLGWEDYTDRIRMLRQNWSKPPHRRRMNNHYLALTDPVLIEVCIASALDACEKYQILRCDRTTIKKVKEILRNNELPGFGVEVIIAAWLMEQKERSAYREWENKFVRRLYESIML